MDYLNSETNRLTTFTLWNNNFINKHMLAKLGFYYTGYYDRVKCNFCAVEIEYWNKGADILAEHIKSSNSCPLLRHADRNQNIPIDEEELFNLLPPIQPIPQRHSNNITDQHQPLERINTNTQLTQKVRTPQKKHKHPRFRKFTKRLKTYEHWPIGLIQTQHEMTDAGFVYNGLGDQVYCYSCNLGLKDWTNKSNPWYEHGYFSNRCNHVVEARGEDFLAFSKRKCEISGICKVW